MYLDWTYTLVLSTHFLRALSDAQVKLRVRKVGRLKRNLSTLTDWINVFKEKRYVKKHVKSIIAKTWTETENAQQIVTIQFTPFQVGWYTRRIMKNHQFFRVARLTLHDLKYVLCGK